MQNWNTTALFVGIGIASITLFFGSGMISGNGKLAAVSVESQPEKTQSDDAPENDVSQDA